MTEQVQSTAPAQADTTEAIFRRHMVPELDCYNDMDRAMIAQTCMRLRDEVDAHLHAQNGDTARPFRQLETAATRLISACLARLGYLDSAIGKDLDTLLPLMCALIYGTTPQPHAT